MAFKPNTTYTAFLGPHRIASGDFHAVGSALRAAPGRENDVTPLVFRDDTGELIDICLRESDGETAADAQHPATDAKKTPSEKLSTKARGRPKLGVVAREVTLLPEHWDWLASQPGGASVALRKLVHEARKANAGREQQRHAQERAYRAMSALAGNLPGFEEASRALFAGKLDRLASEARAWPADILEYVLLLADSANATDAGKS